MTNINPFRLTYNALHSSPYMRRLPTFSLADDDCQPHLSQPDVTKGSFLDHVLHHKIQASQPLESVTPKDVVTDTAYVHYTIKGGPTQTGLMTHWARSGSRSGVIPVRSHLGAALISMRISECTPLLNGDGTVGSLAVIDNAPPT